MAQQPVTDDSPGTDLFPEYSTLYDLIVSEVEGLTDEQLNFESERWEWSKWSKWSIRRQLRHMASVPVGWLVDHWGDTLFPGGDHRVQDFRSRTDSGLETPVIMEELREAIDLTRNALAERSVAFLRDHTYIAEESPEWN